MSNRLLVWALGSGLLLAGCLTSSAHPPAAPDVRQDGMARVAAAADGASCLETCGLEARRGAYADCLASGEDQVSCSVSARGWYRGCIESACSDAEVALDDCRFDCRSTGAAARDACAAADAGSCAADARAATKTCLAACG